MDTVIRALTLTWYGCVWTWFIVGMAGFASTIIIGIYEAVRGHRWKRGSRR